MFHYSDTGRVVVPGADIFLSVERTCRGKNPDNPAPCQLGRRLYGRFHSDEHYMVLPASREPEHPFPDIG